jgi:hypothetical protein
MINALSSALAGLTRAREAFADSAHRISRGDIDAATLVDAKVDALDVRVQLKNLGAMMDREKEVLDILA